MSIIRRRLRRERIEAMNNPSIIEEKIEQKEEEIIETLSEVTEENKFEEIKENIQEKKSLFGRGRKKSK